MGPSLRAVKVGIHPRRKPEPVGIYCALSRGVPGPENRPLPPAAGFDIDDVDGELSGVDNGPNAAGVGAVTPPCSVLRPCVAVLTRCVFGPGFVPPPPLLTAPTSPEN